MTPEWSGSPRLTRCRFRLHNGMVLPTGVGKDTGIERVIHAAGSFQRESRNKEKSRRIRDRHTPLKGFQRGCAPLAAQGLCPRPEAIRLFGNFKIDLPKPTREDAP